MTKVVQTRKTTIFGGGITSTATSIVLSSLKLPDGETDITMSDFGAIGYATIEPATSREEQISFTGITQNVNGTATLTGVTRGVNFVSPYDEVSAYKQQHSGSVPVVFADTAGFFSQFPQRSQAETLTNNWSVPDPVGSTDIANKQYVLSVVNGGAVSQTAVVVAGTAGETLSAGNLVYLKVSDGRWWKADADLVATLDNVKLGIAAGAGTAGNAITGGVHISGLYTTTGLTASSLYYASNTAGAISTSAGTLTKVIGQSISTTGLIFDPVFYAQSTSQPTSFITTSAGAGDSGKGPKLNASGVLDVSITGQYSDAVEFTSSGTWTKDAGLEFILVKCWGGGGSGGSRTAGGANNAAAGGGGGAFVERMFLASQLGATETVTIGDGGTGVSGNNIGNVGGNTTFGSLLTAYGGGGGGHNNSTSGGGGGAGGIFSAGTSGSGGGAAGTAGTIGTPFSTDGVLSANGISAYIASGGAGVTASNLFTAGGAYYGGAGGGSVYSGSLGAAGTSILGGSGGAANASGNGVAGGVRGGGGGGSTTGTSGAGGKGYCVVYEFYTK